MKVISKIILVSLLFGLPLQMCTTDPTDDCNCDPVDGLYFDIKGVDLINYKKIGENSVSTITENEIVQFENFSGINMVFDVDYISQHTHKTPAFSLIPSAYACSCNSNGQNGSKTEEFRSINIFTLNDFDENHLANSNINDLVLASVYHDAPLYIEDYLENNPGVIQHQGLGLKLDRKPAIDKNFKIKVIVALSTGEVYEKISTSFILQ